MSSALTSCNSARRTAVAVAIAIEHPQVVGDGWRAVVNGSAALTLPSRQQEAAINLSRWVHLVFGRMYSGLVCLAE